MMIAGCMGFIFLHLIVSGRLLRDFMIAALGYPVYIGGVSLLTILSLVVMSYGYALIPHNDFVWQPSPIADKVTKVLMLFSLISLMMGTFTTNPTNMISTTGWNDKAIDKEITGTMKITRHPVQWSIMLFAVAHLIANGDRASIILFGTLIFVSSIGMLLMDARQRRLDDPRWQAFMEKTSMVPFAALVTRRLEFTRVDINWKGVIIGIGLYAAIYWMHGFYV